MTETEPDKADVIVPPDPSNAPPDEWVGDPVDPAEEARMLADALAADNRSDSYEVEGWEG